MLTPRSLAIKFLHWKNPAMPFRNVSYSQDGEDIFLAEYFRDRPHGFFVDVGAHHPFRFSNTYLLYQKGWRGINIDATPGSMKLFKKYRPDDINIEAGISNQKGEGKYYLFEEPAMNGFENDIALDYLARGFKLREIITIPFTTLKDTFDEHLPSGEEISFLSMDIEGNELSGLQSNDWTKYKPQVILIEECRCQSIETIKDSDVFKFLDESGYSLFFRLNRTCVYLRN